MRTLIAALLVLMVLQLSANGETRPVFTPTNGSSCRDYSKEFFGAWTCPGPGRYEATFTDEGNVVGFSISRAGAGTDHQSSTTWRGAGKVFGDVIEWRLIGGDRPVAAIVRTWEALENDVVRQALRVFSINGDVSCEFGQVSTSHRNANILAAALADEAGRSKCKLP